MLTVGKDAAGVEEMLEEGLLSCPGFRGRLARWGMRPSGGFSGRANLSESNR